MKLILEYPYQDFDGYLVTNPEGRKNICLVHKDSKKRTTVSFARYLMSIHEQRILLKNEQVDHIDGNKKNDVIENLQIISSSENILKSAKERNRTRKMVKLQCPNCNKVFEKPLNNTHLQKKGHYTSCSRKCSSLILSKGLSINELKLLGINQIIEHFRK